MCNSYRIQPKRGAAKGVASRVADAVETLPSSLVRKSDPGVVMQADGRVAIMRWGYHRSFNPSINNARSDKLEAGMWQDAFHERRCVIPMTLFYEWGPGAGGRKQAHQFHDPDDDYLWAAGIWVTNPELGPCYTMVTTAASPLMAPIHDRMPALLRPDELQEWLVGSGRSGVSWSILTKRADIPSIRRTRRFYSENLNSKSDRLLGHGKCTLPIVISCRYHSAPAKAGPYSPTRQAAYFR